MSIDARLTVLQSRNARKPIRRNGAFGRSFGVGSPAQYDRRFRAL